VGQVEEYKRALVFKSRQSGTELIQTVWAVFQVAEELGLDLRHETEE